ncbi:hypothetical protein HYQ46_005205 [Verticillium longisporum]|nr:hypothetical protein HYQ46_005205 [Verticillium longisporum]
MNSPSTHAGDSSGDDYSYTDSNQRDRTLRALEGRPDDEMIHDTTPPDSARRDHLVDGDDTTGDVFMKIAREEPRRRAADENSGPANRHSSHSIIASTTPICRCTLFLSVHVAATCHPSAF